MSRCPAESAARAASWLLPARAWPPRRRPDRRAGRRRVVRLPGRREAGARISAAAPFDSSDSAAARRPGEPRFRRLARHPLQIRQAAARPGGGQFPARGVPSRPPPTSVRSSMATCCATWASPRRRSPYAANLFDYGHLHKLGPLPINLGFARPSAARFPINAPHVWDRSNQPFSGASYFRFLGRGQRYGLSAPGP